MPPLTWHRHRSSTEFLHALAAAFQVSHLQGASSPGICESGPAADMGAPWVAAGVAASRGCCMFLAASSVRCQLQPMHLSGTGLSAGWTNPSLPDRSRWHEALQQPFPL